VLDQDQLREHHGVVDVLTADYSCLFMFADQDSVQMLQRSSQIGEFYRMAPPEVWDASLTKLPPTYMGKQRSVWNTFPAYPQNQ